jgi:2-succinyl-6-hydroxy-2,4-cyclohexadiene-1-carboxylate synthase
MFAGLAAATDAPIAAPDLPGHGRSTINPVTMTTAVSAVATLLATLPEPPLLLGYSQGGRVALQVALTHPTLTRALVLVSASAGLSGDERAARRTADEALAARIEQIGVARFVDEWLTNPMTSTQTVAPADRAADRELRLENTAQGLAAALRGMGQATVPDSSAALTALAVPVVFVAGGHDQKYTATAWSMARPRGERPVIVPHAGHNVILEAPGTVAAVIDELLARPRD